MGEILSVQPEQWTDPEKLIGIFEPVGLMNDFEKSAYTVLNRIHELIEEKRQLIKGGEVTLNAAGILRSEIRELIDKYEMVKSLMYFSFQDRMGLWNKCLAVSQGFKVVIPEEDCMPFSGIAIKLPGLDSLKEIFDSIVTKIKEREKEE